MNTSQDPRNKRPGNIFPPLTPTKQTTVFFKGNSPEVSLDKNEGSIFILGRLLCENPYDFFKPIVEWAEEYTKEPQQTTTVILNADYINSGSSKAVLQLLNTLAAVHHCGRTLIIKWYCDKGDEDTIELIQTISESIKVKIQIELPE